METLQRTANRGSVSTGYDIDNSCKFEADNTEIIYRTNESGTNRKTFTTSVWFKRTETGVTQEVWHGGRNGELVGMGIITYSGFADQLWIDIGGGSGNTGTLYRSASNQVLRDTSAWYNVCLAVDTTQSTEANRMKVWLNGVEVTSWEQHQIPVQDYQGALESGTEMAWGGYRPSNVDLFSGYIAEAHYLDGVAKVQTDFGEFDEDSGIWKPKAYTGTYGNNGCYMKFDDSSSMGADSSGNGNTFTLLNITAADQATDTPTNNFATLNVLNRNSASSGVTNNSIFTEGNTKITGNLNAYWQSGVSTIGITSGKWYFEAKPYDGDTKICTIGYGDEADIENWGRNNDFPGAASSKSYGYAGGTASGYGQVIPSTSQPNPAVTYNQTNIIGVAIDADNGYVYWSKDGSYVNSGNPASGSSGTGGIAIPTGAGTNGTLLPAVGFYYDSTVPIMLLNFGGYTTISISSSASDENGYGTFEYAPPSGYLALCTKNLASDGGSA